MNQATRTPRSGQDSAPRSKPRRAQKPSFPDVVALLPSLFVVWFVTSLTSASRWAAGILRRMRFADHDAENIRQDATTIALIHSSRFCPPPEGDLEVALRKWFWGIARNFAREVRRVQARRREEPLRDDPPPDALIHPGHAGQVEARSMLDALEAATTAKRWRAWYALEIEGYTSREIALREGVSIVAVSERIRLAREDFATVLGQPAPTFRTRGEQ